MTTPDPSAFTVAPTGEDLAGLAAIAAKIILRVDGDRDYSNKSNLTVEQTLAAVALIRRLSAALATAERDAGEIVADAEARTADIQRDRDKWKSTADAAERERDEARAALGFYALEANWQSETLHEPDPETGEGGEWAQPPALEDQGDIARRSLAKLTEKTT